MRIHTLGPVPQDVQAADEARFDDLVVGTLIQSSGLVLDYEVGRRYGHWYIGSDFDWKFEEGHRWRSGYGPNWPAHVGVQLSGQYVDGLSRSAVHMRCKAGRHRGKPFHWTPYVGIDLDLRPGQPVSLEDRYYACVQAMGRYPLVLRSRRRGLHLFFPLLQPASIFGLICGGRSGTPALIPALLQAAGLNLRAGTTELLPTHRHTLQLPLGPGAVQLVPETLTELPRLSRAEEITRLVETMDRLACETPFDAWAAAENWTPPAAEKKRGTRPRAMRSTRSSVQQPSQHLDVRRLEDEGLHDGIRRNEAAMQLARRKMLGSGWSVEDTVEFLMDWTTHKTNGLSTTAALISDPRTAADLRAEYGRICRGIERAIVDEKVVPHGGGGVGHPLTYRDAMMVFQSAGQIVEPRERYLDEVFRFCLVGFAKDLGTRAVGPARFLDAAVLHAQVPATIMQRWPSCGAGAYRERLTRACVTGFTRPVLNYRHSQDPAQSRATTYELEAEIGEGVATGLIPPALWSAAEATASTRRIHPRQVEHALLATRVLGTDALPKRYGVAAAALIERLVKAYAEALVARIQTRARAGSPMATGHLPENPASDISGSDSAHKVA